MSRLRSFSLPAFRHPPIWKEEPHDVTVREGEKVRIFTLLPRILIYRSDVKLMFSVNVNVISYYKYDPAVVAWFAKALSNSS